MRKLRLSLTEKENSNYGIGRSAGSVTGLGAKLGKGVSIVLLQGHSALPDALSRLQAGTPRTASDAPPTGLPAFTVWTNPYHLQRISD